MSNYITPEDFKAHARIGDSEDDATITAAITGASRAIDAHCKRVFTQTDPAEARLFYPCGRYSVDVDDISTTTDFVLKTDDDGDGVYETTWTSTDFQLLPLNRTVDGIAGWPYTSIEPVNNSFRIATRRPPIQVTAKWGWAAVPEDVEQACRVLAGWLWELRTARLGVAGYGDFGQIRVREHPVVTMLLRPFVKLPHGVG